MDLNINYEKKYIKYKKKYLKLKEELEGGKGFKLPKAKPKARSPKAKPKARSPKAKPKARSPKARSPKARSPKAQTPKPKAQSPKPKAQTPKARSPKAQLPKKKKKKNTENEEREKHFNNIIENVPLENDDKIQVIKQLVANNKSLSNNFYTKIKNVKDIEDIKVVLNDPELQKYPNIKEQIYAIMQL